MIHKDCFVSPLNNLWCTCFDLGSPRPAHSPSPIHHACLDILCSNSQLGLDVWVSCLLSEALLAMRHHPPRRRSGRQGRSSHGRRGSERQKFVQGLLATRSPFDVVSVSGSAVSVGWSERCFRVECLLTLYKIDWFDPSTSNQSLTLLCYASRQWKSSHLSCSGCVVSGESLISV